MAEQQRVSMHTNPTREMPALRRQSLVREVNEQIQRLSERIDGDGMLVVLCECGDPECLLRLTIPRDEYDAVRSAPTRFIATKEHGVGEHVVAARDGYVVVEKSGPGALRAVELDPRRTR